MSLTWKLVLGFLFALVLQISQMLVSSYFTARMQTASVPCPNAMAASLAIQTGVDVVRQLRERIGADLESEAARPDPAVYLVHLEAVGEQEKVLGEVLQGVAARRFAGIGRLLATARQELGALEAVHTASSTSTQAMHDAADFFDDSVGELEQALLRSQIEVRSIAEAGARNRSRRTTCRCAPASPSRWAASC